VTMTRYHSLVIDPDFLPEALHVSAWADDGAVMAVRHRTLSASGVQFHPESVLSGQAGLRLLAQFLQAPTSAHAQLG
jgi:anthranilate/para-aminobenzoate synthase component II